MTPASGASSDVSPPPAVAAANEEVGRLDLARVARWSIPLHLALPWLLWALGTLDPAAPVWVWAAVHVLFPVVLVGTYRLWRGQGLEVGLLIAINHGATFVSGALAAVVAAAG